MLVVIQSRAGNDPGVVNARPSHPGVARCIKRRVTPIRCADKTVGPQIAVVEISGNASRSVYVLSKSAQATNGRGRPWGIYYRIRSAGSSRKSVDNP